MEFPAVLRVSGRLAITQTEMAKNRNDIVITILSSQRLLRCFQSYVAYVCCQRPLYEKRTDPESEEVGFKGMFKFAVLRVFGCNSAH